MRLNNVISLFFGHFTTVSCINYPFRTVWLKHFGSYKEINKQINKRCNSSGKAAQIMRASVWDLARYLEMYISTLSFGYKIQPVCYLFPYGVATLHKVSFAYHQNSQVWWVCLVKKVNDQLDLFVTVRFVMSQWLNVLLNVTIKLAWPGKLAWKKKKELFYAYWDHRCG